MVCSLTAPMNDYMHVSVSTKPQLLCEISKIPLETAVIGTHNLHNKSFEAKRKPGGIFRRERGRGDGC